MRTLATCTVIGLLVLAPGACSDTPSLVEAGSEPILPGLEQALQLTDDDEVVVTARADVSDGRDRPVFPLGVGYIGWIERPDFVAAWAMLADDDDPDCEGTGRKFMKCVKDHLDDGEECTLSKDGDTYVAYCEEPQ
jgi:hypothetical protein